MKETILTRWNDLSVAAKTALRHKEPLTLPEKTPALELLSQISRLTSPETLPKNLIITYHVSDAIFLTMLIQAANPDLSVKLWLPHHTEELELTDSNLIITPYSLFVLTNERYETFSLADFTSVTLDQRISQSFITEILMAKEAHKALFDEGSTAPLLFTNFKEITDTITNALQAPVVISDNLLETIKPKGERISLEKSPADKKNLKKSSDQPPKGDSQQAAKTPAKTTIIEPIETSTPDKSAITAQKNDHSALVAQSDIKQPTADPAAFIAVVARNVQRQYIRDYIREHHLQHVLMVTHNRQSARLLEKYLYRARIRSRVVHEKIDEETATNLFDRYNSDQFTAMILMHRVVEELAAKIQKCDAVIFLDFPTVYSEYANRLEFVKTHFKPQHFISISTENDRAWVQALLEEYPDLNLPLVEVDIKPPKKQSQRHKAETQEAHSVTSAQNNAAAEATQSDQEPREVDAETDDSKAHNDQQREPRNNRRQPRQGRQDQRQERSDRHNRRSDNTHRPQRRRQDQELHEFDDSQSDFFSSNQDEIVNHNRLPFGAGSFEANIARENRRRGRDAFNTPGGIGQSTNGNFLQNITQGFNGNNNGNDNGNSNNNPQSQNRRNNNQNQRNRPRKNNRKK